MKDEGWLKLTRSGLPVNLRNLSYRRTIEDNRVEFKGTWDDKVKGSVLRTISVFANDLYNLNGGYIILGIDESDGQLILPPRGLKDNRIDTIQKEIVGLCKQSIFPDYIPMIFVETFQEKKIIVLWVPPGDTHPYQAPNHKGNRTFWIRPASVQGIEGS